MLLFWAPEFRKKMYILISMNLPPSYKLLCYYTLSASHVKYTAKLVATNANSELLFY